MAQKLVCLRFCSRFAVDCLLYYPWAAAPEGFAALAWGEFPKTWGYVFYSFCRTRGPCLVWDRLFLHSFNASRIWVLRVTSATTVEITFWST